LQFFWISLKYLKYKNFHPLLNFFQLNQTPEQRKTGRRKQAPFLYFWIKSKFEKYPVWVNDCRTICWFLYTTNRQEHWNTLWWRAFLHHAAIWSGVSRNLLAPLCGFQGKSGSFRKWEGSGGKALYDMTLEIIMFTAFLPQVKCNWLLYSVCMMLMNVYLIKRTFHQVELQIQNSLIATGFTVRSLHRQAKNNSIIQI